MARTPRPKEPLNNNSLQENKFELVIADLYHVMYKLTSCSIPGISLPVLRMDTPFRVHHLAGYKLSFDETFDCTFEVDEELKNYDEISNWMRGIAPTDSAEKHKMLLREDIRYVEGGPDIHGVMKDIRVHITTNSYATSRHEFIFQSAFPSKLSKLEFKSDSEDSQVLTATVSFSYSKFEHSANRL